MIDRRVSSSSVKALACGDTNCASENHLRDTWSGEPDGTHAQWPSVGHIFVATYSIAVLLAWRRKGQESDIYRERGESWRQRNGNSILRESGYGGERWPIGSSFKSRIQAVPPTLLSNLIDGWRMI
jgi:hypothetical protein